MVSKKELLLKSIRELLALKVSDKEITLNLRDVGVGEEDAKVLIAEAKQPDVQAQPEESRTKPVSFLGRFGGTKGAEKAAAGKKAEEEALAVEAGREQATEDLAAEAVEAPKEPEDGQDEIAEGLGLGDGSDEKNPIGGKAEKKAPFAYAENRLQGNFEKKPARFSEREWEYSGGQPGQGEKQRLVEDIQVSKLWEKGIMATVNQKLGAMEDLRKDLDAVLDRKVGEANKRETEKTKVLFDSQRALLISKVDSELEAKAKGFAEMIEMKLREMRDINRQAAVRIDALKEAERASKAEAEAISQKFGEADRLKERILSSLNSELINIRSESKALAGEMAKKLGEMDERINKTLQLENQVVEGLVKEAERRVDGMLEEKSAEFSSQSKVKMHDLEEIRDSFSAVQKAELAKSEASVAGKLSTLEARVDKKLGAMDALQRQISVEFKPEKFRQTMQELNEFKAQFVDAIKQNAESFNAGIKRLNQQGQVIERQFMLRAEKIDQKIAELDEFEKNFAKEMGLAIEKIPKKGTGK